METTKKRTREEVRAAFRETMRKKKERMEGSYKASLHNTEKP